MHSRVRRPGRAALERGARGGALGLLAALLWLSLSWEAARPGVAVAGTAELPRALKVWAGGEPAETLHAAFDELPGPGTRALLAALRKAGTAVTWSGRSLVPVAVEAAPIADPAGGLMVRVAAPDGQRVVVSDALGPLDSATAESGGVSLTTATSQRSVSVTVDGVVARAAQPEALLARNVAVLGRAGWESRFVVTALEERGWVVDARLMVAPGIAVTIGAPVPPDTSRHGAVVVLDSLDAATSRAVGAFARSGGGLVLGPDAAGLPEVLDPGNAGPRRRASALSFAAADPRRALGYAPVRLVRGAVPLESRGRDVVVLARRFGSGRVVRTGFDDTWRWRLTGAAEAPDAHRDWWAAMVAGAAYRPLAVRSTAEAPAAQSPPADPAPLAATYAALGPPSASNAPAQGSAQPRTVMPWLAALCLLLLLAEWGSRRLRGAP